MANVLKKATDSNRDAAHRDHGGLAGFNLNDLADEGRTRLDQCRKQARELLDQARQEAEAIRAEAKVAGYEDGRKEAADDFDRRVIDEAPSGGAHSLYGQLHMGGREFSQGDYQASLAAADHVIGSRDAEPFQVVNARWMRANSLIKLGDVSSARQELQSMPEDHAGREGMEPLLQRYRAQLKRLD